MKGSSKSGGRRATGASAARRREAEVPPGQFQQAAEPASGSAAAAAGLFRRSGGRELIICCASMSSARAYGRAVQTHAMGLYCWELGRLQGRMPTKLVRDRGLRKGTFAAACMASSRLRLCCRGTALPSPRFTLTRRHAPAGA